MSETDNRLVSVCIIYADGNRLDTQHEGALLEVSVHDTADSPGRFSLIFDNSALKIREAGTFRLESEVSIHLGYKDDVEEVFSGEVTGFSISFCENRSERITVHGTSFIHRLNHAVKYVHYQHKTHSQIVSELLDQYGLQAQIDEFGIETEDSYQDGITDYHFMMRLLYQYGKSLYMKGKTAYVAAELAETEDTVYEWGKSLIETQAQTCINSLVESVTYAGWDILNCESFGSSATLDEIPLKVGGERIWAEETVNKNSRTEFVCGAACSAQDAKAQALGRLQHNSFGYGKAQAKIAGDNTVFPGKRVQLKYIGGRFEGEYLVSEVRHTFNFTDGYVCELAVKRNRYPGSRKNPQQQKNSQQQNSPQNPEQHELSIPNRSILLHSTHSMPEPRITNLQWKKESKIIAEAAVGEEVFLCADTENIKDNTPVQITLFEKDSIGENDEIAVFKTNVTNSRVEHSWKVIYTADDDDVNSNEEKIQKGYTLPEYAFRIQYGNTESQESPPLNVSGWIKTKFINTRTKQPLKNRTYTIYKTDGEIISGKTNNEGYVQLGNLKNGEYYVLFERENI